jgi:hypothetical protein
MSEQKYVYWDTDHTERAPHLLVNGDVGRNTATWIYGVLKAMPVSMIEGGKHATVHTYT